MDLKGSDAFRFYAHELFIHKFSFDVTNAEDCQSLKESYELLSSQSVTNSVKNFCGKQP